MPSIEENLQYFNHDYDWRYDGDEWDDNASFLRVPYHKWKQSVIEGFIKPHISNFCCTLEIGCGHARWSGFMLDARKLILVDICPSCIEFCKTLFRTFTNIELHQNDGLSLSFIENDEVDFVWSFETFVYCEENVVASYLKEIGRVLKPGGKAIIHHSGFRPWAKQFRFLESCGAIGKHIYRFFSLGRFFCKDGRRGKVSALRFRELANQAGLQVDSQIQRWGKYKQYSVEYYNDWIAILSK